MLTINIDVDRSINTVKQHLSKVSLEVVGERGRHLSLKLQDRSPSRTVFDASKALGKEKDLFSSAYTDFSIRYAALNHQWGLRRIGQTYS